MTFDCLGSVPVPWERAMLLPVVLMASPVLPFLPLIIYYAQCDGSRFFCNSATFPTCENLKEEGDSCSKSSECGFDVVGEKMFCVEGVCKLPQCKQVSDPSTNEPELCAGGFVDCVDGMDKEDTTKTCAEVCDGQCCIDEKACDNFTGLVCRDSNSCKGSKSCYYAEIKKVVNSCVGNLAVSAPYSITFQLFPIFYFDHSTTLLMFSSFLYCTCFWCLTLFFDSVCGLAVLLYGLNIKDQLAPSQTAV